jgi:chromosomal replication initiation ATPase DnaA
VKLVGDRFPKRLFKKGDKLRSRLASGWVVRVLKYTLSNSLYVRVIEEPSRAFIGVQYQAAEAGWDKIK